MSPSQRNPKVDAVILGRAGKWRREFEALREIILDCPLTEEVKWGWPCYSYEGTNVVLIHGFKDYCALLFMKGALMKDPEGVLIQQTQNVQSARQIRFTSLDEVAGLGAALKAYVQDAIELTKAGAKVSRKATSDFAVPDELRDRMDGDPDLRAAFEALTPGRQRGYLFHFSQAKQSKTRDARIEKCLPRILAGKGFDQ
ncbi:MAG TPA: DUF1801 domain-containing protein [Caulobacteraceae bacterium]